MRLQLNNRLYQTGPGIDEQVYEEFINLVPTILQSIPDNIRVALKGVIRMVLVFAELKHPEMREFRPEPGIDPFIHCLRIMQGYFLSRVNNVTIHLTTDGEQQSVGIINSIAIQLPAEGEGG